MMKRRCIITIIALLVGTYLASAQLLSVESFKLLETDLTANTNGTIEIDQNGEKAALIKIITTETGFTFEAGMMGIVKTVPEVSEIWVYVPRGLQKLKIKHPQLGQIEYNIPIPIESARTYELKLISARIKTIIQDEVNAQWVTFSVKPHNAIVTIDDIPYGLQSDGTASRLLPYGKHSYRIDAPGFISENGVMDVGREQIMREVTLRSSKGTVTLECSMKESEIYLNGNLVGTGSWTGELESGMYQVEIKRDGHRSRTTSFMIQPQDEKTISLPVPQPIYGTISVTSAPIGATVYIDGVEVGTTPFLKGEILVGKRKAEFRKQDYRPVIMDVEIKEGELTSFSTELSDVFMLSVNTQPNGAALSIDGQSKGTTPYKGEFSSGDYSVELIKSGYATYKKNLHLDASQPDLSITLQRKILSNTNYYAGAGYQLGHISGIEAFAGTYLEGFNLEGGYFIPSNASGRVWWIVDPDAWNGQEGLEFEYSLSSAISFNSGYGILCNNHLRLTPRVGLLINQIHGRYLGSGLLDDETTFVVSGCTGVRVEYSPIPHVGLVLIPAYEVPVIKGDIASQIDASSTLIKDWCSGFAINLGLELYF